MLETFAVIENGGKQYIARKGKVLFLEKMEGNVGEELIIDNVKLCGKSGDAPFHNSGKVILDLLEQKRDKKIVIFKKKRRTNFRKKTGHRQSMTVVRVKDVIFQ